MKKMINNEMVCNFKPASVKSNNSIVLFNFKNDDYKMDFNDKRIEKDCGFVLENTNGNNLNEYLLRCLMLYFGEDTLGKNNEIDTFYRFTRGTLIFHEDIFKHVLSKLESFPYPFYPKWKKRLLINSIQYYEYAVVNGISMVPYSIGFFAMSIECLSNAYYGKRDKYFKFGDKYINNLIINRLKRYKMNKKYRMPVKQFEKRIATELEIMRKLRNSFYGHSLMHLMKDREKLSKELYEWAIEYGLNDKLAKAYFNERNLEWGIRMQQYNLYNMSLRLNRLLFFFFLGYSNIMPFASHDFSLVGESLKGKTVKRSGMTIKIE